MCQCTTSNIEAAWWSEVEPNQEQLALFQVRFYALSGYLIIQIVNSVFVEFAFGKLSIQLGSTVFLAQLTSISHAPSWFQHKSECYSGTLGPPCIGVM